MRSDKNRFEKCPIRFTILESSPLLEAVLFLFPSKPLPVLHIRGMAAWGRGISKIMDACQAAGIPEPAIEEYAGGIQITFLKDIDTEEYLRKLNLNQRQIKAVLYVKEYKSITNAKYQELNNISKPTATRDLQSLLERKILKNKGSKGAGAEYVLIVSLKAQKWLI